MQIFLALGANLGDGCATFCAAIEALERAQIVVRAVSRFHTSPALLPHGSAAQPDYLNAVLLCRSELAPISVLQAALAIERRFGRDRSSAQRWQPRTLDIDLLAYGGMVLEGPDLALPHPEMHKRRFVLEPLCEIFPEWRHPRLGRSAVQLLQEI